MCLFYCTNLNYCFHLSVVFWKITSPIIVILLFFWTAICFVPTFLLRFIFFNEKVFGFVSKYIWGPGVLFFSLTRIKVSGRENVPKDENFIFVCNHESWLDIPALFIAAPSYLYFIAKKELRRMPFIGWGVWAAGMIFIDRNDRQKAIRSMKLAGDKAIQQKKNIVSFPEGSRSVSGTIMQFKRGTFITSQQTGIRIIPCAISGAFEVWPSTQLSLTPGKIKVVIGSPIDPKDHSNKTPEEFANYTQKIVAEMKAKLQ